ncbi:Protein PDHA-1 a, partial [Aphelenchoides avenae]
MNAGKGILLQFVKRPAFIHEALRCLSSDAFARVEVSPFKLFGLDEGPTQTVEVTKDDALLYYRQMKLIRQMETAIGRLYSEQKVRGYCHQMTGEEATAVGTRAAMTDTDSLITSYRCHGWVYLMGASAVEIIGENMGKSCGNSHGKGGSMHMYAKNYYGGNGIVGAQISLGTGVAFKHKYRKEPNVCVTVYGDGAANQGQFYE